MAECSLLLPQPRSFRFSLPAAFCPAVAARLLRLSVVVMLLSWLVGNASAQPAPPGGFGGNGGGGSGGFGVQGGPGGGPVNGPDGGPPPFLQHLSELNTSAVPTARAEARAAHTELAQAQSALAALTHAKQAEFDARPEIADLVKQVAADKAKYDQLAGPVLAALAGRQAYKTAQSVATSARQNVEALRSQSNAASPQDRLVAAQAALTAKDALTKMESEALAADTQVAAARQEYFQAAASLAGARAQFEVAMKADPDYVHARKSLDDAKAKSGEADAKLADAQKDLADQKAAHAAAMAAMNNRQQGQGGFGGGGGGGSHGSAAPR